MQTRVVSVEGTASGSTGDTADVVSRCPRCLNETPVRLEKADPLANTCFRCRQCGHIFSPRDDTSG